MTVFKDYSRFYDLLYKDKDYSAEADYMANLLKCLNPAGRTTLEMGCGTGRHARLLAEHGFTVCGIDRSAEMIEVALEAKGASESVSFHVGDIQTIRVGMEFDFVISLFHVMSYQSTNEEFQAALDTACSHLKPGAFFLFDAWYGPGVLTDPPVVRVKRVDSGDHSLLRIAEPTVHPSLNVVTVDYTVFLNDTQHPEHYRVIKESHRMRYLFVPEVDLMLARSGLRLRRSLAWMTDSEPDLSTWNILFVAQKQ